MSAHVKTGSNSVGSLMERRHGRSTSFIIYLPQVKPQAKIDLLMTDAVIPHISGKKLADRVRALYQHTKVLFTSAYAEAAIVDHGVLNKGVALLQESFAAAALACKMRKMLDRAKPPRS